jgi:hypothetical protein
MLPDPYIGNRSPAQNTLLDGSTTTGQASQPATVPALPHSQPCAEAVGKIPFTVESKKSTKKLRYIFFTCFGFSLKLNKKIIIT